MKIENVSCTSVASKTYRNHSKVNSSPGSWLLTNQKNLKKKEIASDLRYSGIPPGTSDDKSNSFRRSWMPSCRSCSFQDLQHHY